MADQHPITPPPELIQQWVDSWYNAKVKHDELATFITTQAARWGADQELEACCDWLDRNNQWARCDIDELHDARRPKPPSLKEQALVALSAIALGADNAREFYQDVETIKAALEELTDD